MKLMSATENMSFTKYYLVNYPSHSCCDILTQNYNSKTNICVMRQYYNTVSNNSYIHRCPTSDTNFVNPECDTLLVNSDPYLPRMAARCLLPSALMGSLVTLSTSLFLHTRSSWNSCNSCVEHMYLCTFLAL